LLSPKNVKWRRQHRSHFKGLTKRGFQLAFGDYALMSLSSGRMTDRQIESSRVAISRYVKRSGKLWIRVFPDRPITKKPLETRMGSGKGDIEFWAAIIKPGRILFEMSGITESQAKEAFRLASYKLPFKCKFIKREM